MGNAEIPERFGTGAHFLVALVRRPAREAPGPTLRSIATFSRPQQPRSAAPDVWKPGTGCGAAAIRASGRRHLEAGLALELARDLGFEALQVVEDLLRFVPVSRVRPRRAPAGTSRKGSSAAAWCCASSGATASSRRRVAISDSAEPVERAVVLGVELEHAPERGHRAVVVGALLQQESAVEMRLGVVGLQARPAGRSTPAPRSSAPPACTGSRRRQSPGRPAGWRRGCGRSSGAPRRAGRTAATARPSSGRPRSRRRTRQLPPRHRAMVNPARVQALPISSITQR